MTASHTLTPSQARFMQEHKARRERFAAKARPDTPILCLSASARSQRAEVPPVVLPEPMPAPTVSWTERQLEIHKPYWFSIIEEIDPQQPRNPSIYSIQKATADHYGLRVSDMIAQRRLGPLVRPRQVAIYLAKMLTLRSLPEIGRRFGGRDHSTILHSVRKIASLLKTEEGLAATIESITARVGEDRD